MISTTVVHYSFSMAGSDRQSDSVYIVYQYSNAFEYLVSCTQYSVGVDITIGPYAVYCFPSKSLLADLPLRLRGSQ